MAERRIGLGLRAAKGGAVVIAVEIEAGEPRVLLSTIVATSVAGDRLSEEPYRVAFEMARDTHGMSSREAAKAVATGRARQDRIAAQGLRTILDQLHEPPIVAALLVNRAGWITDLLAYSLEWEEHVPVAERLAIRDALRFALKDHRLDTVEVDETSLPDLAQTALGLTAAAIGTRLKEFGANAGRPWRKEQKLACLAAWFVLHS